MRKMLIMLLVVVFFGCAGSKVNTKSVVQPAPEPTREDIIDNAKKELSLKSLNKWLETELIILQAYIGQQTGVETTLTVTEISFINDYQAAMVMVISHTSMGKIEMYFVVLKDRGTWFGQAIIPHRIHVEEPVSTEAQNTDEEL